MPPLAKSFEESHGPLHHSSQAYAHKPLTASTSIGSSTSSSSNSSSSSSCSSSSRGSIRSRSSIGSGLASPSTTGGGIQQQQRQQQQRHVKRVTLTPYHAAKTSLRAILLFLEMNGVAKGSIQELAQMEFLPAMARAEEYVELILFQLCTGPQGDNNVEALEMLFGAAWTKLVEYTQSSAQKALKSFSSHENKQHQEVLAQQSLPEREQDARQQRHLWQWDPTERQLLIDDVNRWTRAKIDAEKGLMLNQEWARYIRVQQRRIQEYQQNLE